MNEPATISPAQLDYATKQGCADPRCTKPAEQHEEMYIEQRCHPEQPTATYYDSRHKHLVVECSTCKEEVIRVLVACPLTNRGVTTPNRRRRPIRGN